MTLKTLIKNVAYEAGFFDIRVTSAERVAELEHLKKWLSKSLDATMTWIKRDPAARCDPTSLLPGAKSVVCAAMEYKFGCGLDYHDLVSRKLKTICDVIKQNFPSARFKTCVDTSPILEKALAVRAGIGWRGKHSVIIHPEMGSYFVLGEIITDIQIEPDRPIKDGCGNCKKCIAACPTNAIIEPYIIDAGRCISYLTLEHKGPIPQELTKYVKEGQDGCNICQEACPHNQRRDQ